MSKHSGLFNNYKYSSKLYRRQEQQRKLEASSHKKEPSHGSSNQVIQNGVGVKRCSKDDTKFSLEQSSQSRSSLSFRPMSFSEKASFSMKKYSTTSVNTPKVYRKKRRRNQHKKLESKKMLNFEFRKKAVVHKARKDTEKRFIEAKGEDLRTRKKLGTEKTNFSQFRQIGHNKPNMSVEQSRSMLEGAATEDYHTNSILDAKENSEKKSKNKKNRKTQKEEGESALRKSDLQYTKSYFEKNYNAYYVKKSQTPSPKGVDELRQSNAYRESKSAKGRNQSSLNLSNLNRVTSCVSDTPKILQQSEQIRPSKISRKHKSRSEIINQASLRSKNKSSHSMNDSFENFQQKTKSEISRLQIELDTLKMENKSFKEMQKLLMKRLKQQDEYMEKCLLIKQEELDRLKKENQGLTAELRVMEIKKEKLQGDVSLLLEFIKNQKNSAASAVGGGGADQMFSKMFMDVNFVVKTTGKVDLTTSHTSSRSRQNEPNRARKHQSRTSERREGGQNQRSLHRSNPSTSSMNSAMNNMVVIQEENESEEERSSGNEEHRLMSLRSTDSSGNLRASAGSRGSSKAFSSNPGGFSAVQGLRDCMSDHLRGASGEEDGSSYESLALKSEDYKNQLGSSYEGEGVLGASIDERDQSKDLAEKSGMGDSPGSGSEISPADNEDQVRKQ